MGATPFGYLNTVTPSPPRPHGPVRGVAVGQPQVLDDDPAIGQKFDQFLPDTLARGRASDVVFAASRRGGKSLPRIWIALRLTSE